MRRKSAVLLGSLILLAGCSGTSPELGVENGLLAPCPDTPNCVNSQAVDQRHAIDPLRHGGRPAAAKADLLELLAAEPRTEILVDEDRYLRVRFVSAIFRFVDDVEFYLREVPEGTTLIEVRSASRTGYWDFGVNRKRIEQVRRDLSGQRTQTAAERVHQDRNANADQT